MAIIAVHLGVADEEQINNMSYVFFSQILKELGHKLTYDAVVNYAGNSFCEKSWEMIMKNFPLKDNDPKRAAAKTVAEMFRKNAGRVERRIVPRPKSKGEKANDNQGNDGSGKEP